jgi:competence ComEA-like helix-hairpin-helix protein
MNAPRPVSPWSWNSRSLAALVILLCLIGGLIAWRAWANRARVNAEFRVDRADVAPAGERLDPNTASWASLARLPGIGQSRAKGIVRYREARAGDGPAFHRPEDLAAVPDIGPVTIDRIRPHLVFPAGEGETRPSATAPHAPQ